MSKFLRSLFTAAVLATVLLSITGCVSDESPISSEQPWNTPVGFGNGMLPSNINEGR